ncbi:MAG TPA: alkaline phosphatase family protein [Solirubrobacterales bacterium]
MKAAIAGIAKRAAAAAATLTGKRFGLLVASSLVATTGIVAAALTGTGESGALAALLGRSLASDSTPVATAPAPGRSSPGAGSSASAQGGAEAAGGPLASPAPIAAPAASGPVAKEPAPEQAASTPEAGRIKHVFVISLTSPGYEQSFGSQSQMPYLSGTLRPQGQLLSGYALLDDSGLANQIAAISGQPPNSATAADCPTYEEFPASAKADAKGVVGGTGCAYPVETLTIADQLTSGRFSWHAYVEGMVDETGSPHNCVNPGPGEADAGEPGGYVASQNPFVYFHSLLDVGGCAINDVPIEGLSGDLAKLEKTPSYSYLAPTQCGSGTAGKCPAGSAEGAASADAFLSKWVPKILASPAYEKDGLLIVTFAAANPLSAEAPPGTDPLRVGALLLSRFVAPGATDAGAYNPYSLLRSTEELFGLEPLALAAAAKTKSFAAPLLGESTRGD